MGLSADQIAALLAKPQGRQPATGRSKSGKAIDTSVRNYETWFALAHNMLDQDSGEHLKCQNPNCIDPRPKAPVVAEVSGQYMCRHCFLDGWLQIPTTQSQLGTG